MHHFDPSIIPGVMTDRRILLECCENLDGEWIDKPAEKMMINPFVPVSVNKIESSTFMDNGREVKHTEKVISYGLSSFGYDARIAPDYKVFSATNPGKACLVDPKNPDPTYFVHHTGPDVILPPNGFMLSHTIEYFRIPEDVVVICLAKSTYARCGIFVNVTPLEPGWEGQVTLEIYNSTPLPAQIYGNEGIAQFIFLRGSERPMMTYSDRGGKYMHQLGTVPARI